MTTVTFLASVCAHARAWRHSSRTRADLDREAKMTRTSRVYTHDRKSVVVLLRFSFFPKLELERLVHAATSEMTMGYTGTRVLMLVFALQELTRPGTVAVDPLLLSARPLLPETFPGLPLTTKRDRTQSGSKLPC